MNEQPFQRFWFCKPLKRCKMRYAAYSSPGRSQVLIILLRVPEFSLSCSRLFDWKMRRFHGAEGPGYKLVLHLLDSLSGRDPAMKNKMIENSSLTTEFDRRTFVKYVPALAATALVVGHSTDVLAQASPSPLPTPSPTPSAPSPLAEAYAEVVKLKFGKHIEQSQWDRVKRDLDGNIRASDRFRDFKLTNADEPDFVFIA